MTELTPDRCLHELFEERARLNPDALAVVDARIRVTYAELDALADRVARALGEVAPETLVGVLADRSVHAVAAFLGVLKAGGAYVPVDPANPPHRLTYLLADAGVTTVLSRGEHQVPEGPWAVVRLDADLPYGERGNTAHQDNLAYAIYTSGSTGAPKGVLVSHRQIVLSTLAQFAYDRPDPGVFLLLPSLSFDAAADGLYWTLLSGGTVVLPGEQILLDPLALRDLIAREQVTHSDCTPSLYSLILGEDAAGLSSLRCVKVGGEACPPDLLRRHHALLPDAVLVNNYGPTEATVWATTYLSRSARLPGATVPIGAPIPHARVYLLDDRMERVPAGETGELYIAGAGVARGYLGRGGLTAERFLPDPFHGGERMYRTGDLAREGAEGLIEFAGRTDDQVKIRGYRIELGEIENALTEHEQVLVAAVVAHDLDGATPQLVAYVQSTADPETLRDFLSDRLPTHLIPRHIVVVERFPRTVSGKVDKAALPRPEAVREYVEPRTELEVKVAAMVGEILELRGTERVGLTDNLFDLGASSLHISQLALRIWTELGAMVAVHALFEIPTVAGTALAIEALALKDTNAWDLDRLAEECALDPSIDATGLPHARLTDPRTVLMTGVTGYLGAHLLERVLRTTRAEVFCLVRASDPAAGLVRIRDTMAAYRIEADLDRVRVVVGDLGEPRLGLSERLWDELAERVDVIFHNGALVNFLFPYSKLKAPNVEGTVEILRLASTTTVKAVHYVSSIDSFLNTGIRRPFLEDPPLSPAEVPDGYPRSKYVAEQRVIAARERGIPACVYRTGMIIGHTVSGATAPDYMLLQIKGMLIFGVVPAAEGLVDAIPVDFAAQAIATIASRPDSLGHSFHLWNPQMTTFEQVYEWIRSYGYIFESASEQAVMEKVLTIELDNPLFPLLPLYADPKWRDQPEDLQPARAAQVDVRQELANTLRAIEGTGLVCAPLTEEYVHGSIDFMVETGFLDAPQVQRARLTRGD
ncbi:amino acid adenylation domain-containing protein [Nonomuraea sp. NPDC050556]|uniref:amino acid adenylation domain-containing protein n=1 Tax=Nonomuraea sp. NPDC050556 TaxID=3364369 RepID=UPI00379CEDAE